MVHLLSLILFGWTKRSTLSSIQLVQTKQKEITLNL